jgi:hypothetical protein
MPMLRSKQTNAVSGCISGLVGTYLFNLIAGIMGGIDAQFVKTTDDQ